MLLGYTVVRGFASPRNLTWFTRPFSSWRVGSGDETRQIYSAAAIKSGCVMVWTVTTIVEVAGLNETVADANLLCMNLHDNRPCAIFVGFQPKPVIICLLIVTHILRKTNTQTKTNREKATVT